MLKKFLLTFAAALLLTANIHGENIRAELKYSPMEVKIGECGTMDVNTFKLGVEGQIRKGVTIGINYTGNLGKGDGGAVRGVDFTDITHSNTKLYAKLPTNFKKYSKDYVPSAREDNFYVKFAYQWSNTDGIFRNTGEEIHFEKVHGWGIGLGYEGCFSDRFGFYAAGTYYPSMNASIPPTGRVLPDLHPQGYSYKIGLTYNFSNNWSVLAGYEGDEHIYDSPTALRARGWVGGLNVKF